MIKLRHTFKAATMRHTALYFLCLVPVAHCFGSRDGVPVEELDPSPEPKSSVITMLEERAEELAPFPFKLDESFEKAFKEQTGYDQVVVRRLGIFDTDKYVYCHFGSSARLNLDGRSMLGHDTFLARRTKEETDWSNAEFFMIAYRKVIHIGGTQSDADVDRLIAESATKATKESVAKQLLLLGGE